MKHLAIALLLLALTSSAAERTTAKPAVVELSATQAAIKMMWGEEAKPEIQIGTETAQLGGKIVVSTTATLTRVLFRLKSSGTAFEFLADLQAGHRYRVHPDPCCDIAIDDNDSALAPEKRRKPHCVDADGSCAKDFVEVPSWVASDERCGERHTCVGDTKVQFTGEGLAVAQAEIWVGNDLQWTFEEARKRKWVIWPWVRESSPTSVELRIGKNVLWRGRVQLRLEHQYTFSISSDLKNVCIARVN